ncbi:hypothetical protein AAD018_017300 [Aestuariibius insulae]|uniref:hypothetical protein n=1 Tax=Aestuariibius insulae TaxID=2058287 RepID=UPI00345EC056
MKYVVVGVSSKAKTINRLITRADGLFVLIHPNVPAKDRRFKENYTLVDTIEEAVEKIRDGYHARMENVENDQPPDVILHKNIKIWEF